VRCLRPRRDSITTNAQGAAFGGTSSGPASAVSFVVPLKLVSAKNRKIQSRRGTFKNPEVVAFERDFARLVPRDVCKGLGSLERPLRAIVSVFYPSRKSDLDCALLYDCLQTAGVVTNDRHIIEKHEFGHVDKDNPRVEIIVEEL
jgi:Holliday junction resolvase RusA-like endonuclease